MEGGQRPQCWSGQPTTPSPFSVDTNLEPGESVETNLEPGESVVFTLTYEELLERKDEQYSIPEFLELFWSNVWKLVHRMIKICRSLIALGPRIFQPCESQIQS